MLWPKLDRIGQNLGDKIFDGQNFQEDTIFQRTKFSVTLFFIYFFSSHFRWPTQIVYFISIFSSSSPYRWSTQKQDQGQPLEMHCGTLEIQKDK